MAPMNEREHLADPSDIATEYEMRTTEAAIKRAAGKVKRQQERLADGSYEFLDCDSCGLDIGQGRLDAAPMNKLCVFCAGRRERGLN